MLNASFVVRADVILMAAGADPAETVTAAQGCGQNRVWKNRAWSKGVKRKRSEVMEV